MLDAVVTVFGVVMGASPLLQAARVLRRRHSADVSLSMLVIIGIGGALWLAYGIDHGLPAVIIANAVGVTANVLTILACLRYRHAPDPLEPSAAAESATVTLSVVDYQKLVDAAEAPGRL